MGTESTTVDIPGKSHINRSGGGFNQQRNILFKNQPMFADLPTPHVHTRYNTVVFG